MYQALYRKYRPLYFKDVVGQDVIVKTLKQSIINNEFGHAYLFYGSRGTGKTSLSKIFARSINCLKSKDGEACGKCDNCLTSFDKECVDIIEMDAASNNGVDEIRRIIDTLALTPNSLKYKVYIIDEVHMLSTGAFNALLKTLEEPPEHVVFILATTELQKVPSTIVSRCQVFSFKRIPAEVIVNKLKDVCSNEKIKVDDDVLEEIAISANGGMRDSLGMLDKLKGFAGNKITMDDFLELNEIISTEDLKKFCDYIFSGNVSKCLSIVNNYEVASKNLIQIINQVVNYLRSMLINSYTKNEKVDYDINLIISFNLLFIENMFDIKKSDNPKIIIELLIIKFINDNIGKLDNSIVEKEEIPIKEDKTEEKIEKKEEKVEEKLTKSVDKTEKEEKSVSKIIKDNKIINIDDIMNVRFINTLISSKKSYKTDELKKIEKLKNETFDNSNGYIASNLLDGEICCVSDDCVVLAYAHDAIVRQNLVDIKKMTEYYKSITGSDKKLCLISLEKWETESPKFVEAYKNKEIDKFYKHENEPEPVFEEDKKDDIITNSAVDLFGSDIVEIN